MHLRDGCGTFYWKKLRLSIINANGMTVKPKMYTAVGIQFGLLFSDVHRRVKC